MSAYASARNLRRPEVIARIKTEIDRILAQRDFAELLAKSSMVVVPRDSGQFADDVRRDGARWAVAARNTKLDAANWVTWAALRNQHRRAASRTKTDARFKLPRVPRGPPQRGLEQGEIRFPLDA